MYPRATSYRPQAIVALPPPRSRPRIREIHDPDVSGNETDKERHTVGAHVLFDDLLGARVGIRAVAGVKTTRSCVPSSTKAREEVLHRLASLTPVRVFGTSKKQGLSQMFKEKEDGAPIPQGSNGGTTRGDGDHGSWNLSRLSVAYHKHSNKRRHENFGPFSSIHVISLQHANHPRVQCKDAEESKVSLRRCSTPKERGKDERREIETP
ncbi:hypothetical protein EDB89DRAFT_1946467 [Lactarius sanguifluus]|nr:hypothetical protein EDB89DRAFT_1946467 [Lactarius sanguifluus]